jgi:hypothetical protein
MEQIQIWGEDVSNDGLDAILVVNTFPPKSWVSIQSVLDTLLFTVQAQHICGCLIDLDTRQPSGPRKINNFYLARE